MITLFVITTLMQAHSLEAGFFLDFFRKSEEQIKREFPERYTIPSKVVHSEPVHSKATHVQTAPVGPSNVNVTIVNTQEAQETPPPPPMYEEPKASITSSRATLDSPSTISCQPPIAPTLFSWPQKVSKLRLAGCLSIATYCYLQGYLWYLSYILTKNNYWSLYTSKAELLEGLPKDKDIVQILFELEKEITYLKKYQTTVNRMRWTKLFFYNTELFNEIPLRLKRLASLKAALVQPLVREL